MNGAVRAEPEQRCSSCREPVLPGAKVCLKCNNYQDWRRYLGMSQVVLTLLIAFVSVVATGGPGLVALWRGERSDVRVSYLDCKPNEVQLILTNVGTRAATFRGATAVKGDAKLVLPPPGGGSVIDAGQTRIVKLARETTEPFFGGVSSPVCDYDVKVDILGFDHAPAPKPITCPCPAGGAK